MVFFGVELVSDVTIRENKNRNISRIGVVDLPKISNFGASNFQTFSFPEPKRNLKPEPRNDNTAQQCFDSHLTGAHQSVLGAASGAHFVNFRCSVRCRMLCFSKAGCPVQCSVLNNLKPGARCGAWCYQS